MTERETDRRLTELLGEIVQADEQLEPSSRIEQRVMESWDTQILGRDEGSGEVFRHARAESFGGYRSTLVGLGLGAIAVMGVLVIRWIGMGAEPATSDRLSNEMASPGSTGSSIQSRASLPEGSEEAVGFYPIGPDAYQALNGPFRVARVRLPREVLADLGVVLDVNRVGGPVQADVVFGEDGLARAIRLVPVTGRSR